MACKRGHTEIVKALLHTLQECDKEQIQNVFLVQDKRGRTALHITCFHSHVYKVKTDDEECTKNIMEQVINIMIVEIHT